MFTYLSFTAHFLIRLDFPMIRFRTKAASLDFPLTLSSVSFASHRFHLQSASLRFPKYHFANCNGDDYLSFLFIIFCQNVAGTIHSKSQSFLLAEIPFAICLAQIPKYHFGTNAAGTIHCSSSQLCSPRFQL